jgi:hypothetical protein
MGHVEVRREGGRFAVAMRGERRPAGAAILAVWLAGWGYGEWLAAQRLFFAEEAPDGWAFLGLWLALWTAAGCLAAGALLRQLFGSEVVEIEGGQVSLRRRPFGRRRAFPLPEVRALRVEASTRPPGSLAFDASGLTVRFGDGLLPEEAQIAFQALSTRLSSGHSELPPEPPELPPRAPPEEYGHG